MTEKEFQQKIDNLTGLYGILLDQCKQLREQISELKEVKIEEPLKEKWEPKYGEVYYFINDAGRADWAYWSNDETDKWRYSTGVFKTEQECTEYKTKVEVEVKFENYIKEHSESLDWHNSNQEKFYMGYSHVSKKINYISTSVTKYQVIYASSEQILKDAVEYIGGERIAAKYILNIEEKDLW